FIFLLSLFIGFYSCTNEDNISNSHDESEIQLKSTRGIYTFPRVSDITASSVVQAKMEEAWRLMKNNASSSGRSEYGFYIYYDHSNRTYYVGDMVAGGITSGCAGTNASISLGRVTSHIDVCAFFHCHTTLEYCSPTDSRSTGESSSDINFANKNELPGILYDYSSSSIQGGHSKEDSYRTYTFGPDKRPDMPY
ncbi:MAG: hypothetical protein RR681_09400, partial [Lachnospiraceae bacterium]